MNTTTNVPIRLTPGALTELKRLTTEPGHDHSTVLRIGVKGGGCSGFSYVLGFDSTTDSDNVYEVEGVRFVVDRAHELYLAGMEIDWVNGLNNRGFSFNNPNASSTCGCGTSFAV